MFSGIIEDLATIINIDTNGSNYTYTLESRIASELKIDQSVAHNGVCLTVEKVNSDSYTVTAIDETIQKTNLSTWKIGSKVNIERSITLQTRLDGHMVQGHVDGIGSIKNIENKDGSWLLTVEFDPKNQHLVVEKGSITLNGTSLTAFNVTSNSLQVAIIPYTWEHTSVHSLQLGDTINMEFDVIGKYVARMMQYYPKA